MNRLKSGESNEQSDKANLNGGAGEVLPNAARVFAEAGRGGAQAFSASSAEADCGVENPQRPVSRPPVRDEGGSDAGVRNSIATRTAALEYAIYALVDPRDGLPHYIGRTCDPERRAVEHGRRCSGVTGDWRRELVAAGLQAELRVLEWVSPSDVVKAERQWIRFGRQRRWPLGNSRGGGGRLAKGHRQ